MYQKRSRHKDEENGQKEASVTLMAVGDIMLGETALRLGFGVGSKVKKMGANYPFSKVAPILQKGDIVFGNLEAVLSDRGRYEKQLDSLQLRAAPEAVNGLKYASFNVLSLANNHTLEHGEEARRDTVNILSQHGIKYIGVNSPVSSAREPLLIDIKSITVGFLAYCLIADKTASISTDIPEEIRSDVQKAKAHSDILVVSLHWGNEYMDRPSPAQVRLAHQIIDSGASLIFGHHPHVLQGIEKYRGRIIAYSLGNFIFDMWQDETRRSMILQATVSKHGVTDLQIIPVYISDNCQPEIPSGRKGEQLLAEIENYSSRIVIEDAGDYERSSRVYAAEVAAGRSWYRRGLKWYFIKHFYRYKPGFSFQLIMSYLRKKLGPIS